jgi:23S rRNA pseudouridine2605 synthase
VGRLDRASEGLLLLTNDGEVALRLTHPRYGVQKEYQVTVSPRLTDAQARQMVAGVTLEDGPARFIGIELLAQEEDRSRLQVVVEEGRNRLIRRVCEALGYRVLRLKRLKLGVLALGKLQPGETRQLSMAESDNLRRALGLSAGPAQRRAQGSAQRATPPVPPTLGASAGPRNPHSKPSRGGAPRREDARREGSPTGRGGGDGQRPKQSGGRTGGKPRRP